MLSDPMYQYLDQLKMDVPVSQKTGTSNWPRLDYNSLNMPEIILLGYYVLVNNG